MGTFLIIISLMVHQSEGIVVKEYGRRREFGGAFFNAIICFFSMIFFITIIESRNSRISTANL